MYTNAIRQCLAAFCVTVLFAAAPSSVFAQQPPAEPAHQHPQEPSGTPTHDMSQMTMGAMTMVPSRDGSGTSWIPDDTPMYGFHREASAWTLMAHGNVFVQYLHESGDRGSDQGGSINWFMGMADRQAGAGHLGLRAMVSLEPLTIPGCGYPDLLASGERCEGAAIHDRQHPHDLFMELAATYDRPLAHGLKLQLYGGPVGEPALGPSGFPHRLSAIANPIAPMTHHWIDATHITYGVVTGGVYAEKWKAETSVFNGREPDETRTNFDFDTMDSWSGRFSYLPAPRWALQFSAGKLNEAEAGEEGAPRIDLTRLTASATYNRVSAERVWASTLGWGRNAEAEGGATNAFFAETSVNVADRHTWFGRLEFAGKTGHDLGIATDDAFTLAKLNGGYTRTLAPWKGLVPGLGAGLSASIVPQTLRDEYSQQVNVGLALFFTVRPVRMAH
jgi:hypothetical protein